MGSSLPHLSSVRSALSLLLLGIGLVWPVDSMGQGTDGSVHVGPQVGQPGGVTLKVYRSRHTAYDGLITTAGDNFVTLYLHRVYEQPLPDSLVNGYVGPGILVGGEELDTSPRPKVGMSAQVGLNFYAKRFEVFLHATPTLRFLPDVRPTLGGSVGLRYILHQP